MTPEVTWPSFIPTVVAMLTPGYRLNVCVPRNWYIEILTPKMMVLGGEIRSQGWSPHEWDQCPFKRGPWKVLCPFGHLRTQGKETTSEPGSRSTLDMKSADTFTLGLPSLQNSWEINFVYKIPSLDYFCYSKPNRLKHSKSCLVF